MTRALKYLIILTLCSCGQRSEQVLTKQNNTSAQNINTPNTIEKLSNKPMDSTMLEWEKNNDSLRSLILRKKENKVLKQSFLQEMYIRNIVSISKDSLFVTIPFDLHGPDCIAPDCYTTAISFHFRYRDSIIFPKTLQFQEHEHGCVDKEKQLTGTFQLIEQTDKHVIYHSTRYKRTMVLFSSNKYTGTSAYYFTEVGQNTINWKNLYNIVKDYNDKDRNSIYPFTSWVLTTNEYENFMR